MPNNEEIELKELDILISDTENVPTALAEQINKTFEIAKDLGYTCRWGQTPKKDRHP